MSPVSDDEEFRIASAPGDVKPARELYKELLELMRKIAAEGRADERTAKRMEHLAVVRYTAPDPCPVGSRYRCGRIFTIHMSWSRRRRSKH